jgi:hypothetical protein
LQGCFQSREWAVTKVGIWRACTRVHGKAVPSIVFHKLVTSIHAVILSEAKDLL